MTRRIRRSACSEISGWCERNGLPNEYRESKPKFNDKLSALFTGVITPNTDGSVSAPPIGSLISVNGFYPENITYDQILKRMSLGTLTLDISVIGSAEDGTVLVYHKGPRIAKFLSHKIFYMTTFAPFSAEYLLPDGAEATAENGTVQVIDRRQNLCLCRYVEPQKKLYQQNVLTRFNVGVSSDSKSLVLITTSAQIEYYGREE